MKKFIKTYYVEILSTIIPIFIFMLGVIFSQTYPFGKSLLAKYDGYNQYAGFLLNFKRVLTGEANLFYSFKGLLGFNYFATFAYYVSNPTNLLCIFANENNIFEYFDFIIYLRVALCGFTMSKYLKYKYKKSDIFTILFSIMYALSGYYICYYHNYMYFDTVVLFPLVILGLDKLIHENNTTLYIVTLTLSIISNFYIGYMVCIFCLLYFIYSYILLDKKDTKIIKRFIIYSLLSGLMCSFILLPTIYELLLGKTTIVNEEFQTNYFEFNSNYINVFYKLTPGSTTSDDITYGSVNIYCTLFAVISVIKYFFNIKFSKKEKIVNLLFICFFILSISFNLIDYSWHMFQRPIYYPNRYIFTFIFFLISLGYKSYLNKDTIKMKTLPKIIISLIYIVLIYYPMIQAYSSNSVLKIIAFVLSILLIIEYMFLYELDYSKNILIIMIFIELCLNTVFTFNNIPYHGTHEEYYDINESNLNIVNSIDDDSFYRYNFTGGINNNGLIYGFNGINLFDSIRNNKVIIFLSDYLGDENKNYASIIYNDNNVYKNALLGVKYIIDRDEETKKDTITTNSDALSLGFMVNKKVYNTELKEDEVNDNIKNIFNNFVNKDYINYEEIEFNLVNLKIENGVASTTGDGNGYIEISGISENNQIIFFDEEVEEHFDISTYINDELTDDINYIKINTGEKYYIKLLFKNSYTLSTEDGYSNGILKFYSLNYDEYKEIIDELKSNELVINNYDSDRVIKGSVNSTSEKNVLFTTIPYDKGWKVYVDGKKVNYNMCLDTFICVDLDEGEHDITFKFTPYGFIIGSIISIASLLTIILIKKKNKN